MKIYKKKMKESTLKFKGLPGKIIAVGIMVAFICTALSVAQNQIDTTLYDSGHPQRQVEWSAQINVTNPSGQYSYVVFGEAPDANDGPPADSYDVALPPSPMPPYIRVWFNDNLPPPHNALLHDFRSFPDTYKVWNLSVMWFPSDSTSPTNITLSWNTDHLNTSEYNYITLRNATGDIIIADMQTITNYTFTLPALTLKEFTIVCMIEHSLTLTTSGTGSGTIEASPSGPYYHGDVVTIWANASVGSTFTGFSGNLSGDTSPQDLTITDDMNVDAQFTLNGPYTLTITVDPVEAGFVDVDIDPPYYYGTEVTLTAYENPGYLFSNWSGDASGSNPVILLNMTDDKSVTAHYILSPNNPPYQPSDPFPPSGATNVDTEAILSWIGGDPDPEDIVTYDVYFGNNSDPPFVMNNQSETEYEPGLLDYNTMYFWKIIAWDNHGASTEGSVWYFTTRDETNSPPEKPDKPFGPTRGRINIEYTYQTSTTDIDGDTIFYWFDWGDGTNSGWIGPYNSGETATAKHTWTISGNYAIKVKAMDVYGAESEWSDPLPISMPLTVGFRNVILKLLEFFPNAFPVLRYVMSLI
ncbi:MAG: hypothetical protein R6V50_07830 [Thermoplasmatota archaeon]